VLQRGKDVFRQATFTQPALVEAMIPTMAPDTMFNTNATFPADGNSQNQGTASVLYLAEGPVPAGCPTGSTGCTATGRAANAGLFFAFPALGCGRARPPLLLVLEWAVRLGSGYLCCSSQRSPSLARRTGTPLPRKAVEIASNGAGEQLCLYAGEHGEIGIEHHAGPTIKGP
jgi:hypothetical protein